MPFDCKNHNLSVESLRRSLNDECITRAITSDDTAEGVVEVDETTGRSLEILLDWRDLGGQVRVDLRPDLVRGLAGELRQDVLLRVVLEYRARHLRVNLQPPVDGLRRVVLALHQRLAGHVVAARHLWRVEVGVVHPSAGRVYPSTCSAPKKKNG